MKYIKINEIKTPKNVEEFRANLKKYFLTDTTGNCLLTLGYNIPFNKINSISGLYGLSYTKAPVLVPMINRSCGESVFMNEDDLWGIDSGNSTFKKKIDIDKIENEGSYEKLFMRDFEQWHSKEEYFEDENSNNFFDRNDYLKTNWEWVSIEDETLVKFYKIVFGKFFNINNEMNKNIA